MTVQGLAASSLPSACSTVHPGIQSLEIAATLSTNRVHSPKWALALATWSVTRPSTLRDACDSMRLES